METIRICKIRPVCWKIYVQGKAEIEYVREQLRHLNIETTEPHAEPELIDPPLYSLCTHYDSDVPLTREEVEAILERMLGARLEFERHVDS